MQVINLPTGNGDEVRLSGRLDRRFSSRIRAVLRVKAREQHPLLILDCSGSNHIDPFGAAPLIEYMREAKTFGGRLALVGLPPSLKRFLQVIHLSEHLRVYDNRREAQLALLASMETCRAEAEE